MKTTSDKVESRTLSDIRAYIQKHYRGVSFYWHDGDRAPQETLDLAAVIHEYVKKENLAARPSVPAQGQDGFDVASLSEAQPPQEKTCDRCGRFMTEITRHQLGGMRRHSVEILCDKCDRAGAPAAGSAERWIPVSEKLPEKGALVTVYREPAIAYDQPAVQAGHWWDNGERKGWDIADDTWGFEAVTHWQPLPSPPALAGTDTDVEKEK